MPRYRYANGSPKQRKFYGAHEFAKGNNRILSGRTKPVSFPRRSVGASVSYTDDKGDLMVRIYVDHSVIGATPGGVKFWKANLRGMKDRAKRLDPAAYRRTRRSRGISRTAQGRTRKPPRRGLHHVRR